jgi:hypothetical protein
MNSRRNTAMRLLDSFEEFAGEKSRPRYLIPSSKACLAQDNILADPFFLSASPLRFRGSLYVTSSSSHRCDGLDYFWVGTCGID